MPTTRSRWIALRAALRSTRTCALASVRCETDANNAIAAVEGQPELYDALVAAARSNTARDDVDRKLNDVWLTTLRQAGAGVSKEHRHEFLDLKRQLSDLQAHFDQNVADDASAITIGRKQLGGIPSELLAAYTRRRDGSYLVPVNDGTLAFLSDSSDEGTRQAYWMAYQNRAWQSNVPIFERTLAVRVIASLTSLDMRRGADFRLADSVPRARQCASRNF